MLANLEKLAREGSSDKRRELLNGVTAMFLEGAEHHTDRELTLYADVVLQVLDEIDLGSRIEYSERIADHESMPGKVVRHLAHDEIEVATPVLSRSPILTEVDLIKVVERRSQGHLIAITKRKNLSPAVTDSLIRRGSTEVVRSVSGNAGAQFSASGLEKLASKSEHDEAVRDNLLGREDLREELIEKVLPLISNEYATRLRLMIDQAEDGALDEVVQTAASEIEEGQSVAPRHRLETRAIIKQIINAEITVDEAVCYLSGQGRLTDVVTLISKVVGLPEHIVSNVMFKTNNEPVAIICRAVGTTQTGCKAIMQLRAQKLRLPQSHIERGLRDFANLTEETAKRSLRFVKVRASVA